MDMSALQLALGTSLVASAILCLALLALWSSASRREALGYFSAAYAFNVVRLFTQLMQIDGQVWAGFISDICLLGFMSFMWFGGRSLNGLPAYRSRILALCALVTLWITGAGFEAVPYPWFAVPQYGVAGLLLLGLAAGFARRYQLEAAAGGGRAYLAVATLIAIRGLHLLDYPIVRLMPALLPTGFAVGALADYGIGLMLLVAVLGDERRQVVALADRLGGLLNRASSAEQALRDREERLERILDLVPTTISVTRRGDGKIIEANAAWKPTYGYTSEEIRGKTAAELGLFTDDSDRERLLRELKQGGGLVRGMRARMQRSDGSTIEAELSARTFESGGERLLMVVSRDVSAESELVQVQSRLQEREEMFERVFQLIPDALTVVRRSSMEFVEVNDRWEALMGWSREETLGRTSFQLAIWADLDERSKIVSSLDAGGEVTDMLIHMRRRDGQPIPVRASLTVFEFGREKYYLFAGVDVSALLKADAARREAEARVLESEHRFGTMFQLAPVALALVRSASGEVVDVNDGWLQLFERSRSELVGATLFKLNLLLDSQSVAQLMQRLTDEDRLDGVNLTVRVANGRILECTASARTVELGGDRMFVFALVDLTAQRSAEREVRRLNVELEERVAARTRRLEDANRELAETLDSLQRVQGELIRSEKLAALGSLVAGIAHELNTPIGNGFIVTSTLQEHIAKISDLSASGRMKRSDLSHFLDQMTSGSTLLLRSLATARELIRNFKQVAVDQASSQRRVFDLKLVVEEIAATLLPMYRKTNYTMSVEIPEDIRMDSYPGPLGQVITNFTSNSLAHGFEGRTEGAMVLTVRRVGERQVEVSFADDGVGISAANRERIFEPFFTTKLGRGGSGLGMHIVYNLVTGVLGGTISIDSEPGKGARFVVLLPVVAPEKSSTP